MSVRLRETEAPGRSSVYRHWRFVDGLLSTLDPSITTAHEMFEASAKRCADAPCLGYRPYEPAKRAFASYEWMSYATVQRRRAHLGAGIIELYAREGIAGSQHGVGLWCQNRPEWQITDLACMSQSLFTVSLYDTLGPTSSEFIISHAKLSCIVASPEHGMELLRLKPRLPCLKLIIILDPLCAVPGSEAIALPQSFVSASRDQGVKILSFNEVEKLGSTLFRQYNPPSPRDIITINYTSGTTGDPKGAVLTHKSAVASVAASLTTTKHMDGDIFYSYLPLAHIYGRLLEQATLYAGNRIGYFHGDMNNLIEDMRLLKPTVFPSVPRLLNRLGATIKAGVANSPASMKLPQIIDTKLANLNDKVSPTNKHSAHDETLRTAITAGLGLDNVVTMVSGSAPLDPTLQNLLSVTFSARILQGYGMTESYAIALAQPEADFSTGNCGGVSACTEACLLSVEDMGYTVKDKPQPRGELLLRGNNIFEGYYKLPRETSKAFLGDGWFRTGDICSVDELGRFAVIDRKKNVFKLAQGEYISPERIEGNIISSCDYIAQIYVHGDSLQSFLVAIIGVQPDFFASFASRVLGHDVTAANETSIRSACDVPQIKRAILQDFERIRRRTGGPGYEKIRNLWLTLEPFTVASGTLTPTLKLKRPAAAEAFRSTLDRLYKETVEREPREEKL